MADLLFYRLAWLEATSRALLARSKTFSMISINITATSGSAKRKTRIIKRSDSAPLIALIILFLIKEKGIAAD